jgi:hypothetical protein
LGFVDNAGRFLRRLAAERTQAIATMHQQVIEFIKEGRAARQSALFDFVDRLNSFAGQVDVLKPSDVPPSGPSTCSAGSRSSRSTR